MEFSMTLSTMQTRQSERGFTLVELAIVMIIIGLLIGGILKGQELIGNARISSSVAQLKAFETGINTFRDKFAGYPGDIGTPANRVPNCTNTCGQAGNGNGQIGVSNADVTDTSNENSAALAQLVASDMFSGVDPQIATGVGSAVNVNMVASNIAGTMHIVFSAGGAVTGAVAPLAAGHYVRWDEKLGAARAAGDGLVLNPSQSARIDRKMDDGNSDSGSVIAIGANAQATDCSNSGVYNENVGTANCGLYVRVVQ